MLEEEELDAATLAADSAAAEDHDPPEEEDEDEETEVDEEADDDEDDEEEVDEVAPRCLRPGFLLNSATAFAVARGAAPRSSPQLPQQPQLTAQHGWHHAAL